MSAMSIHPPITPVHLLDMDIEKVAAIIVDTGFHIHRNLGPGLLEKVYHTIFVRDLDRRGLHVESKKSISFDYEGLWFEDAFTPDLIVERRIIVELKAASEIKPVFYLQLRTYMRLLEMPPGFLINFGEAMYKNGVKRLTNADALVVPFPRRKEVFQDGDR
jgi:GxxExxY protein